MFSLISSPCTLLKSSSAAWAFSAARIALRRYFSAFAASFCSLFLCFRLLLASGKSDEDLQLRKNSRDLGKTADAAVIRRRHRSTFQNVPLSFASGLLGKKKHAKKFIISKQHRHDNDACAGISMLCASGEWAVSHSTPRAGELQASDWCDGSACNWSRRLSR